jgi:ketosteroid isomerase-like protein
MSRLLIPLLFLVTVTTVSAQDETQKEIIEQIWKPFIEGFNNSSTEVFMSVHSRDLIRSPRDDKSILNYAEYRELQSRSDSKTLAKGNKKNIELRFTERFASNDLAINVGIFKTSYTLKNGQTSDYYGRFHVALRKENGYWKILVDTDSTEGGTIGEKDFLAAIPMQ